MTKHKLTLPLVILILLLSACMPADDAAQTTDVLPAPAEINSSSVVSQTVAYGSSLTEWEDATQAEPAVVEQNEPISLPTAEPSEPVETAASSQSTNSDAVAAESETRTVESMSYASDVPYLEILWDALVPADYTSDAIMDKYADQLASLEDGSPQAGELYAQMQEEFNNAPTNDMLDGALVKLPGFIAPLEYDNDRITEFLLVPYFGACIHSPAPPANQTVLVKTAEGEGIKIEDSYSPIWIMGTMTNESQATDLAQSGYYMEEALIEPYKR